MPRTRTPPRWEQEAPLTAARAEQMRRSVRVVYAAGVAVFWALCVALVVAAPGLVTVAVAVMLAAAEGAAMRVAHQRAVAGIRRSTASSATRG